MRKPQIFKVSICFFLAKGCHKRPYWLQVACEPWVGAPCSRLTWCYLQKSSRSRCELWGSHVCEWHHPWKTWGRLRRLPRVAKSLFLSLQLLQLPAHSLHDFCQHPPPAFYVCVCVGGEMFPIQSLSLEANIGLFARSRSVKAAHAPMKHRSVLDSDTVPLPLQWHFVWLPATWLVQLCWPGFL